MIGTFFLRIMTNEDNAEEVEDDYSDNINGFIYVPECENYFTSLHVNCLG